MGPGYTFIIVWILILGCLCENDLLAQKQASQWYFANKAGLDFRAYPTKNLLGGKTDPYSYLTSCISDSAGNLLFYVDYKNIWNREGDPMPHGQAGAMFRTNSLIIPLPDQPDLFYVFSTDPVVYPYDTSNLTNTGLRLTKVDMALNSGLGDVVSTDTVLFKTCLESITAVHHSNKRDVWVLSHEVNNNAFRAYLVTSTGIQGYVRSEIGNINPTGQIKFSPDGKKVGASFTTYKPGADAVVQLFNFDTSTGRLSNPSSITYRQQKNLFMDGLEFSPTGNFMYFTDNSTHCAATENYIFQIDTRNPADSPVLIAKIQEGIGPLQLGIDGKIYVPHCTGSSTHRFVGCINNPTRSGSDCKFVLAQLEITPATYILPALPSFIQSYFFVAEPVLEMPNFFSPNGDKSNPTFVPSKMSFIETASLVIVNEMGQQVFATNDLLQGWDGGNFTEGVFFWFATFHGKNGNSGTRKGWVQMVR